MAAINQANIDFENLQNVDRSTATVNLLNSIGWEIRRGDLQNAYKVSTLSEEIAKELDYQRGVCGALKTQGYCLWRFSDYPASMEKSTLALKIAKELEDKKEQADILNSIGAVYMFLNDNQNRLKCNLECLSIRKEIGDLEGVSGSLNNTGETYLEMGDLEMAEKYFHECIDFKDSAEDSLGWAYHNLGLLHQKKGDNDKAIEYLLQSIEITSKGSYDILTCNSFYSLAISELHRDNITKAKEYLGLAFNLAKKNGAKEEMQKVHLTLSEIFEKAGEIQNALEHYKKYTELHKQLYNEQNSANIRNIKNQYEIESLQKEAEIERLRNIELKKAFDEIDKQKNLIEKKNLSIGASIQYAKRIQDAILENEYELDDTDLEYFKIFKPRDVVSGDFYWSQLVGSHFYLAVVDCTGHGVPGAFMSMLGVAFLNEITSSKMLPTTNSILDELREKVITVLKQSGNQFSNSDGMDMSIIRLDLDSLEMQYSGAMNSIFILRNNGELEEIRADRMPISFAKVMKPFELEFVDLDEGDQVFMFSDGFADQFGGPKDRKIGLKNFRNWLIEVHDKETSQQKAMLEKRLSDWQGEGVQIDDITLIGLKV